MWGELNYDALRFWFDFIQLVAVVALAVYTYLVNRTKANNDAIKALDQQLTQVDKDLREVETVVKHMPTHGDLGQIHEKVNAIGSTTNEIKGELGGINRTLSLINEHLLNGRHK